MMNMNNLKYNLKLIYYRVFDPYTINHYNVINKLIRYKKVGLLYYNKYPNAQSFENLNKELFDSNPNAKQEWDKISTIQSELQVSVINDIMHICNCNKNSASVICSTNFKSYFIEKNYHIGQYVDTVIELVKKDIKINKL